MICEKCGARLVFLAGRCVCPRGGMSAYLGWVAYWREVEDVMLEQNGVLKAMGVEPLGLDPPELATSAVARIRLQLALEMGRRAAVDDLTTHLRQQHISTIPETPLRVLSSLWPTCRQPVGSSRATSHVRLRGA